MIPKFMNGLFNLKCANSQQLDWLIKWRCEHRHNGVRHFNCYLKDNGIVEHKGFLDIEASNLKANFGIVLCWCILDDKNQLYEDFITPADVKAGIEDKRIVQTCIDTMRTLDRVIGHFSTYYDIPFLRTRALIHGLDFPKTGELCHTDVWKMAKQKLCIHSNRQATVAEAILGSTVKTRIDQPSWRLAMMGNVEAMKEVVNHCEKDVQDLKRNYDVLLPYFKETRSSI